MYCTSTYTWNILYRADILCCFLRVDTQLTAAGTEWLYLWIRGCHKMHVLMNIYLDSVNCFLNSVSMTSALLLNS
jgi:hypothetical protein